ncbi:ParB N-terminal domain-containing protein [Rhodobacteraceae bacterium DSL-40]|uniref:ParB N-terminal domain-containing protein n=1 Tax=Amaricoccus sp. B4 TaxID=3368557 RepID=UPI000DAB4AFA
MPQDIHQIPIDEIDAEALARDRVALDPEALTELRLSIAASGLRSPIELFAFREAEGRFRYGLISGYRRLTAVRALHELTGQPRYARIDAFLRTPDSAAAAFAAMVEENEIRDDISPWERGRIALVACEIGLHETIEAAVDALYPSANAAKRSRLRALARAAEAFQGHFAHPEALSQKQLLRLAATLGEGLAEPIRAALAECRLSDPESQWRAVLPLVEEAERQSLDAAAEGSGDGGFLRQRRLSRPRPGLTIRRERTLEGYTLRFSGSDATSGLMDHIIEEIERLLGPA